MFFITTHAKLFQRHCADELRSSDSERVRKKGESISGRRDHCEIFDGMPIVRADGRGAPQRRRVKRKLGQDEVVWFKGMGEADKVRRGWTSLGRAITELL